MSDSVGSATKHPTYGDLIASARANEIVRLISMVLKGILALAFGIACAAMAVAVFQGNTPANRLVLVAVGLLLCVSLIVDVIQLTTGRDQIVHIYKRGLVSVSKGVQREARWRDLSGYHQRFPIIQGGGAMRIVLESRRGDEPIELAPPLPMTMINKAILAQISTIMEEAPQSSINTRTWLPRQPGG